jgi:hypothetical protein
MKFSISKLRQIIQEELEAELQEKKKSVKKKKKKKDHKVKTPKHFTPREMPGTADDVFHNCILSVKKSFKKHDYKPYKGKNVEDAAAAICTDSRKEGGATLDWGEKRRREVEKARPGGLTGKEKTLPKRPKDED